MLRDLAFTFDLEEDHYELKKTVNVLKIIIIFNMKL